MDDNIVAGLRYDYSVDIYITHPSLLKLYIRSIYNVPPSWCKPKPPHTLGTSIYSASQGNIELRWSTSLRDTL